LTYAISDIHGEYERFLTLLDRIHFSPDDTLYLLGDLVDRGPQPMQLLQDVAARDNVYALLGNHDAAARELLRPLMAEITDENAETHLDAQFMSRLTDWLLDGGESTLAGFRALSPEQRLDVLDFLDDLPLFETVDAGERTFILAHAGLGGFSPARPLRSYLPEELLLHNKTIITKDKRYVIMTYLFEHRAER